MDDLILLFLLSCAMFIGSYVAGLLPIILPFSESKLRLVTITGAGLLVGTALAVIIPEGVNSIYKAHAEASFSPQKPIEPLISNPKPIGSNILEAKLNRVEKNIQPNNELAPGPLLKNPNMLIPPPHDQLADKERKVQKREVQEEGHHRHEHIVKPAFKDQLEHSHSDLSQEPDVDVHSAVGLALVAGFVLMLLVDQLAQSRSSSVVSVESGVIVQQSRYKLTATIGLVVHAAADGVALGAASGSSHDDVQFIVFVAIMLHKAPAAFGLATFLLHEGLDRSRIKRHLLIFSLAAPVAALVTFFFLTQGGPESLTSLHATGVLLLFSAGTFLYVATVHVLPEVTSSQGGHHHGGAQGGLKLNELFCLVMGAVMPTFLTVGHSH